MFLVKSVKINQISEINKGDIGTQTNINNENINNIPEIFWFFNKFHIFSNFQLHCSSNIFQTVIKLEAFKKLWAIKCNNQNFRAKGVQIPKAIANIHMFSELE